MRFCRLWMLPALPTGQRVSTRQKPHGQPVSTQSPRGRRWRVRRNRCTRWSLPATVSRWMQFLIRIPRLDRCRSTNGSHLSARMKHVTPHKSVKSSRHERTKEHAHIPEEDAGCRIVGFILGLPGTVLTFLVVQEGSERAYGIEHPTNDSDEE